MSRSPTYVGRLDPQFRRFVNVLSVYPTSPTSSLQSLIDEKDEAATSLASTSCSGEKFPEFLTVDAYTDETWSEIHGQREVSELYLEYVNVLSSGSESSLMADDKEIATSTATSRRRNNPQNGGNSGQRSSQDRIPEHSFEEDSVFERNVCSESFYDKNYCLQKRPGVSNERHHNDFNRPVSGSFSSEADSERNYTDRNEFVCLKDSGDIEGLPGAEAYSRTKENISSVPRLRGQEVISRSPQDTSRHMDDSLDDSYSVDSELGYSPDIIEDECSSTSSADSSFVWFALVGEQEEAKTKRKIASNVSRGDRHKMHRSKDSSWRGETDGKEHDHGVMACVVTGISGGPAVRVYRDDNFKKSATRPKRSEREYLGEVKEVSKDGKEMEADTAAKDFSKGSHLPRRRSKERSRGFVFGVFGTPENPALEEDKSTRGYVNELNSESGASSCDMENVDAYRDRLPMFSGMDLQSKTSVNDKRINERSNVLSVIEYDIPMDNMLAKSKATEKALNLGSFSEERIDDISIGKPSTSQDDICRSSPSHCTNESKSLPSRGKLKQTADVNEDGKGLRSSKSETEGEDKEQVVPLQKHSSRFIEHKREVRVKAISKSVQDRRPRRKRKDDDQYRMEHDKVKPRDEEKLPDETNLADSQREHNLKDDLKMSKLSSPLDSANCLGTDSHKEKQDSQATGYLQPRTRNLRHETLLMTGDVQGNISDEYTAAEFKSDLLTPVKQTVRESIEAGFVDNGTSGEKTKTRLNDDDQVCPESSSNGAFGTRLEGHRQQQPHKDQNPAMEIAGGHQSMSGDIIMEEHLPVFDLAIDHSKIISKKYHSVSALEIQSANNLAVKNNSSSSQNRDTDYAYCFNNVEDEPKDNDNCVPVDHDINDASDEHDHALSVHVALPERRKNDDSSPLAEIQGITTHDSVETVNTWEPGSATDQERKVRDTSPESRVYLKNPCQPMEQSFANHRSENEEEILSLLKEDDVVSQIIGTVQRKHTPEVRRKNSEDQKLEAEYSKRMKSLSEASQKDNNLHSHSSDKFSGYSGTEKLFSRKEPFKTHEEISGKAVELPVRSVGGQPSIKEAHAFTKTESNTKPSEVDTSGGRAIERGSSSTMDSVETTKSVEMFTPEVSPTVITAQAYVLINNGTKNISYVPEFDGSRDVAPTAAQEATKYESQGLARSEISGHDDFSFSGPSSERFADESVEVRANVYQSSLSTKSSSYPDMEEVVEESSSSKVKGEVQRTNLTDNNEIFSGDDSRWIHLPPKEEDQCLSFPSAEKEEKENLELKKRDRIKRTQMDPPISEKAEMAEDSLTDSAAGLYDTLDISVEESDVVVSKIESLDGHLESLDNKETSQISTKQPSTITILPYAQRPREASKILVTRPKSDSCKDTAEKCDKSLHPLVDTIETLPSVSAHCGCLQRYLHQRSQEKESDCSQESVNFSASLQKLDAHSSLQGAEDGDIWSTFKANEYHANPSVPEVFDQHCQVELLKEGIQPEYNTKESQTPFWFSVSNKECQTNESIKIDVQPESLQRKSTECQTEPPPNFYASCGVQVECDNIQINSQSIYADQDCQTDYELILKSSKRCQTLSFTEDPSRFSVDHRNANLHCAGESYNVSFENKECETSQNYQFSNPSSERTSKEVGPSDFLRLANKECQTSNDILLATSSTQCNILPSRNVAEALISGKNKPVQLPSCESKECQTLLDDDMILTSSKHCQTPSWPHALEEIAVDGTNVGDDSKTLFNSKECQTTPNNSPPLLLSNECQTLVTFASDIPDTLSGFQAHLIVAYNSVESQTTPDAMNDSDPPSFEPLKAIQVEFGVQSTQTEDTFERITPPPYDNKESQTRPDQDLLLSSTKVESQTTPGAMSDLDPPSFEPFKAIQVEFSVQSTQTEDTLELITPPPHDNKESQTTPDQDLLLSSSKVCQTTEPVTAYENRESQTLPEGEIFLVTSKECQTMPYHKDNLDSELPNYQSEDTDLSNDTNAEVYSEIYTSPQMTSRLRPATYGKSPETTEKSFFEFQTEYTQTNIELHPRPIVSSLTVDLLEKGCQTTLCNCGSDTDESNFASVSSDTENGAAMRVSEGMQKEQASLIKQLDMLRDMNQKLRDDKDAIEAAHEAKKTKVARQGSQMSKYVKKRRAPPAEETWGNQGSVESFSGEEVDGPNYRSSVKLHDSIQEEAEFEGDPTLEIISDEKLKELEQPAWAKKIMSCVQPIVTVNKEEEEEEEDEEDEMGTSDEELDEDVFRKRKAELTSGAARSRLKAGENESDMSYSEGLSGETGSETDDRPNSPRAAPVGKDNEMCRTVSQDMSEAGVSTISEPATPERVFKVVFVGDSGVGKSSFIHRFCHDAWKPSFTATIGVDFQIKTMSIDSRCIALQLWDTAGQERFRSITKQYFRKADGVIVFYDVTMETSFLNIKNWMISVEEGTDDGTAIMIVGNKTDLAEDDSERAVKSQDGKKLAEEYKALYTETSAKTGYNIQESMAEFSKMLQVREDELMQSVLNLVQEPQPKKKCCK